MAVRYAYDEDEAKTARARVEGVNASYKDLINVCSNVRGWNAERAVVFLQEAADGDRPVRYYKYNKKRSHIGELGGKKGGWPVKSCTIVLGVLKNAMANAEAKGYGPCRVVHIQANKQEIYSRMSPKGRRIRQDLETAFVEIVLRERQGPNAGLGQKKAEIKKADEEKKSEAKKAEEKKAEEKKVEAQKVEEKKTEAKKAEEKKIETKPVETKTTAPSAPVVAKPVVN